MNGSPITSWEGVEAYYTYADSPFMIAAFLVLTCAVVVGVLINSARHETVAFKGYENGDD
jgi:hypothetical protein